MNIGVIGGTGKAGKYLVKQLVRQGYSIKLLARNPLKLTYHDPLIEVIHGNARDYPSVYQVIKGCDAVISTLGPSRGEPDTCSIAVKHINQAMKELNIKRYIEVAGLAIDTPGDRKGFRTRLIVKILKWFFPRVIGDRQKGYALLSASDLKWTIVRCPMIELTDSTREIKISLFDSPGRKVSASDLAKFLVSQLTDEQYIHKCPFISN